MSGYLLDAGVISSIRNSGLSVTEWVGSAELAVARIVVSEVFADLAPTDIQAVGNIRVLAQLPQPIAASDEIEHVTEQLRAAYASHQPALAINDSLIIATAIVDDRIAVTMNRRDFHYPKGLRWIDANGFDPSVGSLLSQRGAAAASPGNRQCCQRLQ